MEKMKRINNLRIVVLLCILISACANPRDTWKNSIEKAEALANLGKVDASIREFNKTFKHADTINSQLYKVDWPYSSLIDSIDKANLPAKRKLPLLVKMFKFTGSRKYRHNTPGKMVSSMSPAILNLDLPFDEKFEIFVNKFAIGDNFNQANLEIMFNVIKGSSKTDQAKTNYFDKVYAKAWNKIKTLDLARKDRPPLDNSDQLYLRVAAKSLADAEYLDPAKRNKLGYSLLEKASSGNGRDYSFITSILLDGNYESNAKVELYNKSLKLAVENEKWSESTFVDVFNVYLKDYITEIISQPMQEQLSEQLLIKGKLLPISASTSRNKTRYKINYPFYLGLPDDLLAKKISDVDSLVLIEYLKIPVGQYTSGGLAYKTNIKIKLIDLSVPAIIHEKTFYGTDEPPSMITVLSGQKGGGQGDAPVDEVVDYLSKIEQDF